ncbi:hypothetical protein Tco_0450602 [Tanacetum coccineum]
MERWVRSVDDDDGDDGSGGGVVVTVGWRWQVVVIIKVRDGAWRGGEGIRTVEVVYFCGGCIVEVVAWEFGGGDSFVVVVFLWWLYGSSNSSSNSNININSNNNSNNNNNNNNNNNKAELHTTVGDLAILYRAIMDSFILSYGEAIVVIHGILVPPRPDVPLPDVNSNCFDINLPSRVFSKKLRMIKCIPPKMRLEFANIFRSALKNVLGCPRDLSAWVQLLIMQDFILWRDPVDRLGLVLDQLAETTLSFSGVKKSKNHNEVNMFQGKRKLGDGHFTVVIKRRLVSKVASFVIGNSMNTYLQDFQFGVDIPSGYEAVLHSVNRLIEFYYDDSVLWSCHEVQQGDPLGPLLFDLALHPLVYAINQSCELTLQAWYLDEGTIIGDTLMVTKALEIIMTDALTRGLFLNVDKIELFRPVEDPRGRMESVFPINISRPLNGVKLLGGSVSLDAVLSLLEVQVEFYQALHASLERIVTASGPGFGDWQWRLATLSIKFGGLGILSAGDIFSYTFLSSRLQMSSLHAKISSKTGIVSHGYSFQYALAAFISTCNINALSVTTNASAPI